MANLFSIFFVPLLLAAIRIFIMKYQISYLTNVAIAKVIIWVHTYLFTYLPISISTSIDRLQC